MADQLLLERRDGWPQGLARVCAALWFVLLFWGLSLPTAPLQHPMVRSAWLCLASALVLSTYRRGTLLDRHIRTMRRWWGIGLPFLGTFPLRHTGERSLQGYQDVALKPTGRFDTWKTWRTGMMHVQLERPDDKLGPTVPFRVRLIVDDELTSRPMAEAAAQQVGEFLGLPVRIDL